VYSALVGANLTTSSLQIDLVAIKENKRDTMHVQGISYWAPANIGPYSQSVIVSCMLLKRKTRKKTSRNY
jgi:diphthine-ammonia ligase